MTFEFEVHVFHPLPKRKTISTITPTLTQSH